MMLRALLLVLLSCTWVNAGPIAIQYGDGMPAAISARVTTLLRERSRLDVVDRARVGNVLVDRVALVDPLSDGARVRMLSVPEGLLLQDRVVPRNIDELAWADAIAAQLESAAKRPAGRVPVTVVPAFISRDPKPDSASLRHRFPALIQASLLETPGTDILAFEQAALVDALSVDRKPTPPKIHAVLTGEYQTSRGPSGGDLVAVVVRLEGADRVLLEAAIEPKPLRDVEAELRTVCLQRVVPLLNAKPAALAPNRQTELFSRHAVKLTESGDPLAAAMLLESALRVEPQADAVRTQLIGAYCLSNSKPIPEGTLATGETLRSNDPRWVGIISRVNQDWTRALALCEYLIRNKRVSREEATQLAQDVIRSLYRVRNVIRGTPVDFETAKKKFLREVLPLVPALEPASKEKRAAMSDVRTPYEVMVDCVLLRLDGGTLAADDLDLLAEMLTTHLPADRPDYRVLFMMQQVSLELAKVKKGQAKRGSLDEKAFAAFLDRLEKSDRPLVRVYARHTRLYQQVRAFHVKPTPQMYAESQSVVADAEKAIDAKKHDFFLTALRDLSGSIGREVAPKPAVANAPPLVPPRNGAQPVKPNRATLEPIAIKGLDNIWPASGGMTRVRAYRPLGKGLDAFWADGAVLLMTEKDVAEEVFAEPEKRVCEVIGDGRFVYIATASAGGIYILDSSGKQLAHVDEKLGLPPSNRFGMTLFPAAEGKILAAGAVGEKDGGSGWLATVSFDGANAKVDVIYNATKPLVPVAGKPDPLPDPTLRFDPGPFVEHTTSDGRRLVYVGRLVVDLRTMELHDYLAGEARKNASLQHLRPPGACLSIDGVLWVAGSWNDVQAYKLDQTDTLVPVRERKGWHNANAADGKVTRMGDWLYYAGGHVWRRINLKTGEDELIVEAPNQLPGTGSNDPWFISTSSHYGLVAFSAGKIYRVLLDGKPVE